MVSTIVIEYEELGNTETLLRLTIDGHLIAENLTPEETRRFVVGILKRIAVLDVEENDAQHRVTEFAGTRRH
jgi:hypothetical protein